MRRVGRVVELHNSMRPTRRTPNLLLRLMRSLTITHTHRRLRHRLISISIPRLFTRHSSNSQLIQQTMWWLILAGRWDVLWKSASVPRLSYMRLLLMTSLLSCTRTSICVFPRPFREWDVETGLFWVVVDRFDWWAWNLDVAMLSMR